MSGPLEVKVGLWRLVGAPGESVALWGGDAETPHAIINPLDVQGLAEALLAFVVQPPADPRQPQAVECRSCGASMLWAVTPAGRRMPVNAEPDPAGALVLTVRSDAAGRAELHLDTWRADEPSHAAPRRRWTSHFASCPGAAEHRRAR